MKITKLEHSGVVIEENERRIVIDPVEFVNVVPKLENVVAIVVTHKHSDHFQPEVIAKILKDNPSAAIFTTGDTNPLIDGAIAVKSGDTHTVGEFKLDFFGKDHAAIIPGQIPCENIGVVVNERIVNPGDSFDLPNFKADVLFAPIEAPWLKIVESMNFIEEAKPEMVIPVHDAFLSDLGKQVSGNWMKTACDGVGAKYAELKFCEDIAVNISD